MDFSKIKEIISKWNSSGLNLPVMRDPLTNKGSITATLVVISSILLICSLMTTKIDKSGAFQFYATSTLIYLGRKFQTKDISGDDKPKTE